MRHFEQGSVLSLIGSGRVDRVRPAEMIWPGVLSRSKRGIAMLEKSGLSITALLIEMFGPRDSLPTAGVDADVQEQIEFYWQQSQKIVQIAEEADGEEKEHTDTNKTENTDTDKTDNTDNIYSKTTNRGGRSKTKAIT